jgi:DNA-binding SARP family transcriptional activator/DNA-binding XRE family transcriptional regulator
VPANRNGSATHSRFGLRLRDCRRALRLTQQELADAAGLSVAAIRDLEQGRRLRPRPESVALLSAALQLTPAQVQKLVTASLESCAGCDGHSAGPGQGSGPGQGQGQGSGLRISLLGPLTASYAAGPDIRLGPPRQRAVLALLALSANRLVHRERIIDTLWADEPPRTATGLVQAYVSRLRRALAPALPGPDGGTVLTSVGASYQLAVGADELDLLAFRRLVMGARAAGDGPEACRLFEQALALWRGDPLAGVEPLRDHPVLADIRAEWTATVLSYAATAVCAGWHEQVLPPLRALTRWDPLNEQAHAHLMIVLAGLGQQAAALRVYERLRDRLDTQLGVQPGKQLADAHLRVLRQDIPVP